MTGVWGYRSVGVLLADALDLVQAEPVISLRHLAQVDDQFVGLLHHLADLGQDEALGLGDGEDPVLSLIVMDADLERSVQEARGDLVRRHVSDLRQWQVDPEL
jgi:hypothetical protein